MTSATITVTPDGTAVIDRDGQPPQQLHAADQAHARQQAVAAIIEHAHRTNRPVRLLARDDTAEHFLDVHPDGTVCPAHTSEPEPHGTGNLTGAAPPPTGRLRRRWTLVTAAVATGLAVSTALWLRPAQDTSAGPTAQTAAVAPSPAPVAIDADTLGVIAAARSAAPRPVPLPVSVNRIGWNGAAVWQERRTRQATQPVTTWTAGPNTQAAPVPWASGTSTAPTSRAPAAVPPTRPQVIINPEPAPAASRPAQKQPAGPAMPDQPTNPTNPN